MLKVSVFLSIVSVIAVSNSSGYADENPLAHVVSPNIYKVMADNDFFRVIEATWRPGERDAYHSHPLMASYRMTDCTMRVHRSNGTTKEIIRKIGSAGTRDKPVKSHSLENIGDNVCRMVLVELK